MNAVITVKNLVKRYGAVTAVNGISFTVKKGEIFGLLGPNGAGKTTTLEIIEGMQLPTSGQVRVLAIDPVANSIAVKRRIGIQLQSSAYFEYLNLVELLDLFASFYNKASNAKALLNIVGLWDKRRSKITQLSGGQRQRFSIVAALVNDPDIVFLDEPTTGLDPQARRNLWQVVRDIRARGKTVILTTHYMEEAQVLCDRVAIIDQGKIIAVATPAKLIAALPYPFRIIVRGASALAQAQLEKLPDVVSVKQEDDLITNNKTWLVGVKTVQRTLPAMIKLLQKVRLPFEDLEVIPANLEDVFLRLTGKALRD